MRLRISKGVPLMSKSIRRTLALLACAVLLCSSSTALAAAKKSKTFTQAPTLKASSSKKVDSASYDEYTVTASLPGFLTVKLIAPDGSVALVLEENTEIHSKANLFGFYTKDAQGNPLPIGDYTLQFDMVSQFGVAAKTLTKEIEIEQPDDLDTQLVSASAVAGTITADASAGTAASTASTSSDAASSAKPAAPANTVVYGAGEFTMGDEGLLIGVGVTDTATQEDAGYWGLTADATDAQIWAAITRKLTGVDVGESESAYIYNSVSKDRKSIGTVSGISQGVNLIVERSDGWSLVEAYRNEDGAFVRGYIRTNKLRTSEPNATYGMVIDKKTQTLTVYKEGARIGSVKVSTGLPTGKYLHRETPAGEFITVTRRGTTEYYGDGYSKYTIRINGSYHLSEIPSTKKNGTNFSKLEGTLGSKATRGNVCIAHEASADGGINAEWIWNMTTDNKRVKVLILDDKPRTDVPSGN